MIDCYNFNSIRVCLQMKWEYGLMELKPYHEIQNEVKIKWNDNHCHHSPLYPQNYFFTENALKNDAEGLMVGEQHLPFKCFLIKSDLV